MTFPVRTAREIPAFGSNGDPVETCRRGHIFKAPEKSDAAAHGSRPCDWLLLRGLIFDAIGLAFPSQRTQPEKAEQIHHCLKIRHGTHLAIVASEQTHDRKDEQEERYDPQGAWGH